MSDALFDLRLERAARRIADEGIRPIDAVAIAEAAIRSAGRAADLAPRSFGVPRAWLVLAGAALAVVVAASLVVNQILPDVGNPSPAASSSPTPPPAATAGPVVPGSGDGGGTWLADIPGDLNFDGNAGATRMALTVTGQTASIGFVGGTAGLLASSFVTANVGEIQMTSDVASNGAVSLGGVLLQPCLPGDAGAYQSTTTPDGFLLTLELIEDDCDARGVVFARTWTRSLTVPNGGGVGVVDGFDPLFTVELPPGSYVVSSSADHRTIFQDFPELQFLSFKNPQGFNDPCDLSKGRREIEPGADAVVAYFQQLAGFTVDSVEETTVDGFRAVRLVVHADVDASCPDDDRLWDWQPEAEPPNGAAWFLHPGVTDSLIIVDHPAGTLMFELLPAPNPREDEVIGSIRFLDELPTTP